MEKEMSPEIDSQQAPPEASSEPAQEPLDAIANANLSDNGGMVSELEWSEEEVKTILQDIASTGAVRIEWDKLKDLLSFKLKQVLAEYPEGKMSIDQQNDSLGETYEDLVRRLDEALISFEEGPPFTIQRLCELLLDARSIYPKLSKLALALEKNLLVSSMLTTSCVESVDTQSEMMVQGEGDDPEKTLEKPVQQSLTDQNGGEDAVMGDRDVTMADVVEADEEGISIDKETIEDAGGPSEEREATPLQ